MTENTVGYKTKLHKAGGCYWLIFNNDLAFTQMFKSKPTKTQIMYFITKFIG